MNQKYKNWPAICGIRDDVMRMAVALVDLNTEEGQQFAEALPTYFSNAEVSGPIPLSALLQQELNQLGKSRLEHGGIPEQLESNSVLEDFSIPFTRYRTTKGDYGFPVLPEDIDYSSLRFAQVFEWRGKKLFVAEYYPEQGFMEVVLCPAERIFVDVPKYQPQTAVPA